MLLAMTRSTGVRYMGKGDPPVENAWTPPRWRHQPLWGHRPGRSASRASRGQEIFQNPGLQRIMCQLGEIQPGRGPRPFAAASQGHRRWGCRMSGVPRWASTEPST